MPRLLDPFASASVCCSIQKELSRLVDDLRWCYFRRIETLGVLESWSIHAVDRLLPPIWCRHIDRPPNGCKDTRFALPIAELNDEVTYDRASFMKAPEFLARCIESRELRLSMQSMKNAITNHHRHNLLGAGDSVQHDAGDEHRYLRRR